MKKYLLSGLFLSASIVGGCVTNPLESALNSGGIIDNTSMIERIGDTGVTATAVDGAWIAYWSADGRKVVKVKSSGEIADLKWRTNENGEFCEQVFSAGGAEFCGDEAGVTVVKSSDGNYFNFRNGKAEGGGYKMESGNIHGL